MPSLTRDILCSDQIGGFEWHLAGSAELSARLWCCCHYLLTGYVPVSPSTSALSHRPCPKHKYDARVSLPTSVALSALALPPEE